MIKEHFSSVSWNTTLVIRKKLSNNFPFFDNGKNQAKAFTNSFILADINADS
jgi:hypothetical protein